MTVGHFLKLMVPKFKWFVNSNFNLLRQWRRLKTTEEIRDKGNELMDEFIVQQRKNTNESLKDAFRIKSQIDILLWVIGEKDGV